MRSKDIICQGLLAIRHYPSSRCVRAEISEMHRTGVLLPGSKDSIGACGASDHTIILSVADVNPVVK